MKEELHLNKLTHIEKLDMFIDRLKLIKQNSNLSNNLEAKNSIELMNMLHDYEAYWDALDLEQDNNEPVDYKKIPYISKIKNLYFEAENKHPYYQSNNKLFNSNMELNKDVDDMISSQHFKMMMLCLFFSSNKRIFKISQGLMHLIDHTDYNNDVSYIRTPYDCIYMQFPSKFGDGKAWGGDLKGRVEGVYVSINDGIMRYVLVPRSKLDIKNLTNSRLIFTECIPSQLSLEKKVTIKEIIKKYRNANDDFVDIDEYVLTTIIKILMYITSINVDTEKRTPKLNIHTKKKKLLKKGKTTIPYEYVGGNIIINNNNNFTNGSGNGTGRQITTKFMVRGHYRGFWMNLNDDIPNHQIVDIKDDRMLVKKWVEPFWKGSEFAEVVLKDYKVN
tara:strand:+ start:42 stop:1208 length:1167 start_codon:yes stop_codon:yes gene_type:complete